MDTKRSSSEEKNHRHLKQIKLPKLEKGGLKERLQTALEISKTVNSAVTVAFSDDMPLGLIGQVRRVLPPRGVKIVQPLQREYKYE
jgi:hypothetical protein